MERDIYAGRLKLQGEEHQHTLSAANNYANNLVHLKRFQEARSLMRKMVPVARRVLGKADGVTFQMSRIYAVALYLDTDATLHDLNEAVTRLEEIEPTARRVLGGAHPLTLDIEDDLRTARAVLRAREDGKRVEFVKH